MKLEDLWMALNASSPDLMPEGWDPIQEIGKIRDVLGARANESLFYAASRVMDDLGTYEADNYNRQISGDV